MITVVIGTVASEPVWVGVEVPELLLGKLLASRHPLVSEQFLHNRKEGKGASDPCRTGRVWEAQTVSGAPSLFFNRFKP